MKKVRMSEAKKQFFEEELKIYSETNGGFYGELTVDLSKGKYKINSDLDAIYIITGEEAEGWIVLSEQRFWIREEETRIEIFEDIPMSLEDLKEYAA